MRAPEQGQGTADLEVRPAPHRMFRLLDRCHVRRNIRRDSGSIKDVENELTGTDQPVTDGRSSAGSSRACA